jgi:ATP-binding cassette subfamily B protein
VILAFNRRDYFRERFEEANKSNYAAAVDAGIANNIFIPVYGLFAAAAQLLVLTFGLYLISTGHFSIGLLVSYLSYAVNFYNPLRQLAALWANFQAAMAGWDRVSYILSMESNLPVLTGAPIENKSKAILEFKDVSFGYDENKEILHHVNFTLEAGKTYALVGPTGGGKTTTASLIARLYDPVKGTVLLDNKDIRTYPAVERLKRLVSFYRNHSFLREPYVIIFYMEMSHTHHSPMNNWKKPSKTLAWNASSTFLKKGWIQKSVQVVIVLV